MARPAADDPPYAPGARPLPPSTPYEQSVVAILGDVVDRSDISLDDPLLSLGGLFTAPHVVAQIRRTLGVDVPVAAYLESRTVAGLAATVAARSLAAWAAARPRPLGLRGHDASPVLSYDQQRLWMENQLLPGVIYNVHGRRRILGRLDVATLEASIRTVIARHEALRTRFPATDDVPVQVVDAPDDGWRIRVEDLCTPSDAGAVSRGAADQRARQLLDQELTAPFDLTGGPLIRCMLVKLGETEHLLAVTMHHIVSDAWSIGLFVRELTSLYRAGGDSRRARLDPLHVQYRDYAVWQRGWLVGDPLEHHVQHWRKHLEGALPATALPTVQRRTNALRPEAGQVWAALSEGETATMHALCRERGVTSFMVLFAVLATIFSRWSGQRDIVIGVPVAGRNVAGTAQLIGFFVNLLPLRIDLSAEPTFDELLEQVRAAAVAGYAHAEAPMDELVRTLGVVRDPRRTPLFEVVLNVVASPEAEQVEELAIEVVETPSLFSRYDFTLTAQESEAVLRFKLDFPADRCDERWGRALLAQVRTLLRAACADTTCRLLDQPVEPTPAHRPPARRPVARPDRSIAGHALREAARPAVVDGDGPHDYRWMAMAVDAVAAVLDARTIPGGEQIGVVRRPTAGFVVTLVAAARLGLDCYVTDTDDPAFIGPLGLSTVVDPGPVDVAADGTLDLRSALAAVGGDGHREPAGPGGETAEMTRDERLALARDDRVVVLTSRAGLLQAAVDAAFAACATLVVPQAAFGTDPRALVRWLEEQAITVGYLDAPILRAVAALGPLPALRCVVLDNRGDLLPHDVVAARTLAPGCRVVSLYRVSSAGVPLAAYEAPHGLDVRDAPLRVPLGAPTPGSALSVRLASGAFAAVGELAEIWDEAGPTGDHGRRWPDGSIDYALASAEHCLADPAQTESALRDIPAVYDAVVLARRGTDEVARLQAYVAGPRPGTEQAIRGELNVRLPDYLVPVRVHVLAALPRTPWGEYDLQALQAAGGTTGGHVAPQTPVERQLTDILEQLLERTGVGIYDSFFELGGFSMLATKLITRMRDTFGVQLSVREVFESPTVEKLALLVLTGQARQADVDDLEALLAEVEAQP